MRRGRVTSVALAALVLAPASALAQVPASAVGLGYPVFPTDGRSSGLGGTTLGLLGETFSLGNPADMAQHANPGFALSFNAEGADIEGGGETLSTGRHRFNLVRAIAPFSDWAVGIAFGSAFDQDWSARFQDTLVLADGSVPFEETREHDGGISTIDVSLARRVGSLDVGVTASRWIGSLRQTFSRLFEDPIGDAPSLNPSGGTQSLSYKGWRFQAGAAFEVEDRFRVSGTLFFGSTLTATPDGDAPLGEVDLPTSFLIGASARPVSNVILAGSYGRSSWSSVQDIGGSTSQDIERFGGGLEYEGLDLLGGDFPVRIGYRRSGLPFSRTGDGVQERALTTGFGWIFRDGVAQLDMSLDVGTRGDLEITGSEESFRRLTVSFALRQFPRF